MAKPKGFGISAPVAGRNTINRTRSWSTQTSDLTNSDGEVINQFTHGTTMEKKEQFYADDPAAFKSPVIDGQSGPVVSTGAEVTEDAGDWAKATVTTRHLVSEKAVAATGSGTGE